jgi:hypothetical protein
MALITYHSCDRCGTQKKDGAHPVVELLLMAKAPDKSMTVVVASLPFGGTVVKKTVELCDGCCGKLAEQVDKFMKG